MLTKLSKHRLGIKKAGEKDSGNADLGKTQVLKSHGDRTNTFGVANGRQEMSVLITNSSPCTKRSASAKCAMFRTIVLSYDLQVKCSFESLNKSLLLVEETSRIFPTFDPVLCLNAYPTNF